MKINSVDNICALTLEHTGDSGDYSGFKMEVHADIRHGQFDAKNIDVQFLNLEIFIPEFDRFIRNRGHTARLEGTYDTYIAFSASGVAVMLQYQLGDAFCGRKTSYFHQSGEFEVDQENLRQYLDGFRSLMEAQQRAPADAKKRRGEL
jgi:hypothetical protein